MKNYWKAALLITVLIFSACKKDKKDDPATSNEEGDAGSEGFYIKVKVNGTRADKIGGQNGCEVYGNNGLEQNGDGMSGSYFSWLTDQDSVNFCKIGRMNVYIDDTNDSDELASKFNKGYSGLGTPYDLTYYGTGGVVYYRKPETTSVQVEVDSVADLGGIKIDGKTKRAVKVIGTIDSVRLYEWSTQDQDFTTNYVDLTELEFAIRYHSQSDL